MTDLRLRPAVLAGLSVALLGCEQFITNVQEPELEVEEPQPVALADPSCFAPTDLVSWWPGDGVGDERFDDVALLPDGTADPFPNHIAVMSKGAGVRTATVPWDDLGTVGFGVGQVGQAFSFTSSEGGSVQFLEVPDPGSQDLKPAEFTVDLWAMRTGDGMDANRDAFGSVLVQKAIKDDDASSGLSYSIAWHGDGHIMADVNLGGMGNPPRLTTGVVPNDTWVHIALTVSSNLRVARLYLDGVESDFEDQFPGTAGVAYGDGSIVFGSAVEWARTAGYRRGFHGLIDEVDLFGHVLGPDEVMGIYTAGSDGKCLGGDYVAEESEATLEEVVPPSDDGHDVDGEKGEDEVGNDDEVGEDEVGNDDEVGDDHEAEVDEVDDGDDVVHDKDEDEVHDHDDDEVHDKDEDEADDHGKGDGDEEVHDHGDDEADDGDKDDGEVGHDDEVHDEDEDKADDDEADVG